MEWCLSERFLNIQNIFSPTQTPLFFHYHRHFTATFLKNNPRTNPIEDKSRFDRAICYCISAGRSEGALLYRPPRQWRYLDHPAATLPLRGAAESALRDL